MLTPASAAGPVGLVVAELADCQAASGRAITQQAGQHECHGCRRTPSRTPPGLMAGKWGISAGVFVIAGAVVEQCFEAAHTRGILHQRLS